MITLDDVKSIHSVDVYIREADKALDSLGYTEHSFAHITRVSDDTGRILRKLGHDKKTVELGRIAGYLHDIGNLINRVDHSQSGAIIAFRILDSIGMPPEDISVVVSAIGNHDEGTGTPVNAVAAALIMADKADVRRSRVRDASEVATDIHDRVNYSVIASSLDIDEENRCISLELRLDTEYSSIMEFFEIFLGRMKLCRLSAKKLGVDFKLIINGQTLM
ncbi:MAG: HD domain-containing protein [Clostridia bacterium]|nr:HD domain-containing protein [Clostridia bacterium]